MCSAEIGGYRQPDSPGSLGCMKIINHPASHLAATTPSLLLAREGLGTWDGTFPILLRALIVDQLVDGPFDAIVVADLDTDELVERRGKVTDLTGDDLVEFTDGTTLPLGSIVGLALP